MVEHKLQRNLREVDYLDPFESGFRPEIASFMLIYDLWQSWDGDSPSSCSLISEWLLILSNHSCKSWGLGELFGSHSLSSFVSSSSGCW